MNYNKKSLSKKRGNQMNCEINFTFDDGTNWTGYYYDVTTITTGTGENDTQDVYITSKIKDGNERVESFDTQKVYWVVNFQVKIK
jgi:hypothetical protein